MRCNHSEGLTTMPPKRAVLNPVLMICSADFSQEKLGALATNLQVEDEPNNTITDHAPSPKRGVANPPVSTEATPAPIRQADPITPVEAPIHLRGVDPFYQTPASLPVSPAGMHTPHPCVIHEKISFTNWSAVAITKGEKLQESGR
ncbi:hypothetical protein GOODEAATRI_017246 [Goodea atripinnis]|uniref:Uncharacterized protein n=1 Tax=Goodea atripinnis TaxID=208336 RepID=A0ABV0NBA4_9TELE